MRAAGSRLSGVTFWAAAFLFAAAIQPALAQQTQNTPPGLERLTWLAGDWGGTLGRAQIEEHWLPAGGQIMLGVARTVAGGRTVSFEFLRIEARADGVYYVAQPGGRPPTDFKATQLEDHLAVFENPQHDHPKIIRYSLQPDGTLLAQIEGDEKGEHRAQDFLFRPMKNP